MLKARRLQDKARERLKGNMRLLLMNAEDVAGHPRAKARLDGMLAKHADINAAYVLKEKLRAIYANAKTKFEAAALFKDWIGEARATGGPRPVAADHFAAGFASGFFASPFAAGLAGFFASPFFASALAAGFFASVFAAGL